MTGKTKTIRQSHKAVKHGLNESLLRAREAQLEIELADTKLLHSISAEIVLEENTELLYGKLVDAAMRIMRSDFGSLQMLYPERGELRLLAARGFSEQSTKFWEWVRTDTECACGQALRSGARVIVPDVDKCEFMAGTASLVASRDTGIRSVQSTPLYARGGKLVGMISTHWRRPHQPSERSLRLLDILSRQVSDLIERKQAEEALRASEARMRFILDSMPQMIFTARNDGEVDYVNRAWLEFTGLSFDELRNPSLVLHPQDLDKCLRTWQRSLESGEPFECEHRLRRHDGEYRWHMTRVRPMQDAAGRLMMWIGCSTDVHELKLHEAALPAAK